MDNSELQDELEALRAIYADDLSEGGSGVTVRLAMDGGDVPSAQGEDGGGPTLVVSVEFPPGYPSEAFLKVTKAHLVIRGAAVEEENIAAAAYEGAKESEGFAQVFSTVEAARQEAQGLLASLDDLECAAETPAHETPCGSGAGGGDSTVVPSDSRTGRGAAESDGADADGAPAEAWSYSEEYEKSLRSRAAGSGEGCGGGPASSAVAIHSSEYQTVKKSRFQAHLAEVKTEEDVRGVLRTLISDPKIQRATHPHIYAYVLEDGSDWRDDDGETGAGDGLLRLLQLRGLRGIFVACSRWYGGIHLGPDRFRVISGIVRELLDERGFTNTPADGGGASTNAAKGKGKKKKK